MAIYSAHAVATELRKRVSGLPTKKLHKLLYYVQAHHLATFGTPLFSESIMAWDMGPVVSQLWFAEDSGIPAPAAAPELQTDEAALNTIGFVVARYGKLSGPQLERLSHSEAPWIDADRSRQSAGKKAVRIEQSAIAAYFREQAQLEEAEPVTVDVDEKAAALIQAARFAETVSTQPAQPDDRSRLRELRAALLA